MVEISADVMVGSTQVKVEICIETMCLLTVKLGGFKLHHGILRPTILEAFIQVE